MPWGKLDLAFFRNPKTLAVGGEARLLYLAALCYAGDRLTDGLVPDDALPLVAAEAQVAEPGAAVARLVKAGLWHVVAGGHRIHDYFDFNATAKQVKVRREAGRVRAAERRAARKAARLNGSIGETGTRVRTAHASTTIAGRVADAARTFAVKDTDTESDTEEVNAPPTPSSDDEGERARAAAPVEQRAVPKPWEKAKARCEPHPLFDRLGQLFGRPVRPKDWEALDTDLDGFDARGATVVELDRRVAAWTPVMGRRPDGSELFMSRDALITHWARLGAPLTPAPARPSEVRGMVVPIDPPPRMTREQGAAYRRAILNDVRRAKERREAAADADPNAIAAEELSPPGGRDAVAARALGGD